MIYVPRTIIQIITRVSRSPSIEFRRILVLRPLLTTAVALVYRNYYIKRVLAECVFCFRITRDGGNCTARKRVRFFPNDFAQLIKNESTRIRDEHTHTHTQPAVETFAGNAPVACKNEFNVVAATLSREIFSNVAPFPEKHVTGRNLRVCSRAKPGSNIRRVRSRSIKNRDATNVVYWSPICTNVGNTNMVDENVRRTFRFSQFSVEDAFSL